MPFVLGVLGMLLRSDMLAEDRFTFVPALDISEVQDDNLFLASSAAARDRILRVSPSFGLRFASPRLSASGSYAFDADRYAAYSHLSNRRARQRALAAFDYRVSPRLSLGIDGGFTDTDTPSDFNLATGLAAARTRAQRVMFTPSARFRVSPRMSVRLSFASENDKLSGGTATRSQLLTGEMERKVTPRDSFALNLEFGHYVFDFAPTANRTKTYVLRSGWTHDLDARTRLTLSAGPRVTNGSLAPEWAASLSRRWAFGSITVSGQQTATTAIGLSDTVQVRSVDARFAWAPTRALSAYAGPAIFRTTDRSLQATVYQIALGARYAFTPLVGFDMTYSLASQRGAIDPVRAVGAFSHSVLSVGFTTRWSAPEAIRTVQR